MTTPDSFTQVSPEQQQDEILQKEYLMSLHLTPQQLAERQSIEFVKKTDGPLSLWFAAIKSSSFDYVFEISSAINDMPPTIDISVRGETIDPRQAYTVICKLLCLNANEISWIADSI